MAISFNVFIRVLYEDYQPILVLIGFIVMLMGMVFNILVRRELGKNWVPLSKTTEEQELVTSGIYSKSDTHSTHRY